MRQRRAAASMLGVVLISIALGASGSFSISLVTAGVDGASLAYQPGSDSLVTVVRPSASTNGSPLQMVTLDGAQFRFARAPELPFEAPLAIVHDDGDFQEGVMFSATDAIGQVAKLSGTGSLIAAGWAKLPGESGRVTALAFSLGEPFGRSVIVGSENGNVWRIDDEGRPTFVASTGYPVRAVLALPAAEKYGSSAGMLLVATGAPKCQLLTMDLAGRTADLRLDIGCATDLDVIAPDTDLFFTGSIAQGETRASGIMKVARDGLATSACDVLVTHQEGPFSIVGWSPGRAYAIKAGTADIKAVRSAFGGSPRECYPEVCGDGIDNNGDGEIDEDCPEPCLDPENCENHEEHADESASPARAPEDPNVRNAGCPAERWAKEPQTWEQFDPKQLGGTVFSFPATPEGAALSAEPLLTLLTREAATTPEKGRPIHRLAKAAIAAALNAGNPKVGYPLSSTRVMEHVNAAMESGNIQRVNALAGVLDAYNAVGCTLPDQKGASPAK